MFIYTHSSIWEQFFLTKKVLNAKALHLIHLIRIKSHYKSVFQ